MARFKNHDHIPLIETFRLQFIFFCVGERLCCGLLTVPRCRPAGALEIVRVLRHIEVITRTASNSPRSMSAADYAALPTTDDQQQDSQSYPPVTRPQPVPKEQSGFRANRFWPDLSTLTNRAILILTIGFCVILFLRVEKTFVNKETTSTPQTSESEKPVDMSNGYEGRRRTGKLNVG